MSALLNKVEKDKLQEYIDIVKGYYSIKDIYSGKNIKNDEPNSEYIKQKNRILKEINLGSKLDNFNYDNKMIFLFKILLDINKYSIPELIENIDGSTKRIKSALIKAIDINDEIDLKKGSDKSNPCRDYKSKDKCV